MNTEQYPPYLHLSCPVQSYAWGRVGLDSQVAQLKKNSEPADFVLDSNQTYAEVETYICVVFLWFGNIYGYSFREYSLYAYDEKF